MYTYIKDIVKFLELELKNLKPIYFNKKDCCFYPAENNPFSLMALDGKDACNEDYVLLPNISLEEIANSYLEYSNDINLKRKILNRISLEKNNSEAKFNYELSFNTIMSEEELEVDWKIYRMAELQRIADSWCVENDINLKFSEVYN